MKKLNLSIALICSGVSFLISCTSGDAIFHVKSKNYGDNDVIGISQLESRENITAKNLNTASQTFSTYIEKKGYARLFIDGYNEKEFLIYLADATYEVETDRANPNAYPVKSSSSKEQQEMIEYYKIKDLMNWKSGWEETVETDLDAIQEFAGTYPASKHTLLFLGQLNYAKEKHARYQAIFNLMDPSLKESKEGKKVEEEIRIGRNMDVGSLVQNISGKNLQGEAFNPKVLEKINVFICWATYDILSRRNNIDLRPIYEKYRSQGVEFIGVSYDKDEKLWRKVIMDDKASWPQYTDFLGARSPNAELSNHRLPYIMITDRSGKILSTNILVKHLDLEIDEKLKQL